eukprot:TRINITY_DN4332_c0_g1_i1.p1 TRINITY_DN4332_c0_g1~~TRINITY_DN4332_c0_g1_i1.p1  ORF type:complete len:356 (+),score=77.26 TRINITY_DN4332_c0_g1_i1:68-1135(+)
MSSSTPNCRLCGNTLPSRPMKCALCHQHQCSKCTFFGGPSNTVAHCNPCKLAQDAKHRANAKPNLTNPTNATNPSTHATNPSTHPTNPSTLSRPTPSFNTPAAPLPKTRAVHPTPSIATADATVETEPGVVPIPITLAHIQALVVLKELMQSSTHAIRPWEYLREIESAALHSAPWTAAAGVSSSAKLLAWFVQQGFIVDHGKDGIFLSDQGYELIANYLLERIGCYDSPLRIYSRYTQSMFLEDTLAATNQAIPPSSQPVQTQSKVGLSLSSVRDKKPNYKSRYGLLVCALRCSPGFTASPSEIEPLIDAEDPNWKTKLKLDSAEKYCEAAVDENLVNRNESKYTLKDEFHVPT